MLFCVPLRAGEVVRLAVGTGRDVVVVRAKGLAVMDGDVRDLLVRKRSAELVLRWSPKGLVLPGSSLRPRSVLLFADGPLHIAGRDLIGQVEVRATSDGLMVINRLELERYLQGVLGAEMASDWPLQALRAQAVAARTFFLHRRMHREQAPFDLTTTTLDQVYKGIARESARTRQAASSTRAEVLTWGNLPAETLYHSCCAGRTRSAEEVFGTAVAYLRSVDDPDCRACPKHRWRVAVPTDELVERLVRRESFSGPLRSIGARGQQLVLVGGAGRRLELSRRRLRTLMGSKRLPSSWFSWHRTEGALVLDGRGSGHGVGLCQWGARGMAERGEDYRAILARYYPGCTLRKLY